MESWLVVCHDNHMRHTHESVGVLLREWRQRRHLSQFDLAFESDISTRHLSFVETGRSQPSRDMVLHLAEQLDVPLRERNTLLVAAGYAPVFAERPLTDPSLDAVRHAVDMVLSGHEPYPALAIDRHWNLVAVNKAVTSLLEGVDAALLQPPVNVLRLSLHPSGLAPRIANLREWQAHLMARLERQIAVTGDCVLVRLKDELRGYNLPDVAPHPIEREDLGIAVPLRLITDDSILTFLSTTMVFGSPVDVTVSEIAIEAFFPADPQTTLALQRLAERRVQEVSRPE